MTAADEAAKAEAKATNDRNAALRESYSKATAKLRENHLPEFNALRKQFAFDLGHEWTPAPTEEEKAAAEIQRLLAEHPSLAGLVVPAQVGTPGTTDPATGVTYPPSDGPKPEVPEVPES